MSDSQKSHIDNPPAVTINSIALSSASGIDATTITLIITSGSSLKVANPATQMTFASPLGTKVPGGPGLGFDDISSRIFLLSTKPVIQNISFKQSGDGKSYIMQLTILIKSENLPAGGRTFSSRDKRLKRVIPVSTPPGEISPIGAVSVLSSPVPQSTNTQLVISFLF